MAAEKIDALQLDVTSSVSTDKVDELIDALGRLGTALDKLKSKSVSVNIRQTGEASNKAAGSVDKLSSSFLNQAIRITALVAVYRKLGKVVSDGIANSATYIKSLNMFTVSLGEYADNASKYGETVSQALGIDIAGWQKTQGIFQTLITGFGVTGDKAAYMSQNITQLSYDIASFYGITNEEAANKLKSALSGRLEPIRKLGYDLSQAKLVDIGQNPANYGKQTFTINKETGAIEANTVATDDNTKHKIVNFNQLTQQEKVQLRYIALMQQVTQVQGNYARALNDPANQLNVFKEQLNMTSRALGNIFIPFLNKALPYLTAFAQLAQQAFQSIANLFGFKLPDMKDRTDISKNVAPYNKVVKATGDAAKNAKKMKDYMLGIDELNVFNPNTGAGGAGGAGGGENSNLKNLKLPGYDFLSKAVENSIKKAKEAIQKFFDDLKKDPFILSDIFRWGAGELGADFWEKYLGKTPEQLKKEAALHGRTIGEEFWVQFWAKAKGDLGSTGSGVWSMLLGKSPDELAEEANKNGLSVGEQFAASFFEKIRLQKTWLQNTIFDSENIAKRAKEAGRTFGEQFGIELMKSYLEAQKGNPLFEALTRVITGKTVKELISGLDKKIPKAVKKPTDNTASAYKYVSADTAKKISSIQGGEASKDTYETLVPRAFKSDLNTAVTTSRNTGKKVVDAYTGEIAKGKSKATNAGDTVSSGTASGLNKGIAKAKKSGMQTTSGYVEGVLKLLKEAGKAGGDIGLAALKAANKKLKIESPSKAFAEVGKYSVLGFANAIESNSFLATNAVSDMSKKALNAMSMDIIDPMSSGTVSMPSNNNAGYAIGAANEGAMATLASNIYQAVVGGMSSVANSGSTGNDIKVIIDGKEVFKAVQAESRKRGVAISNGAFSR